MCFDYPVRDTVGLDLSLLSCTPHTESRGFEVKSAVLLFLISGAILFADTTPAEVTYSNPTFLQAGPAPFVIVGADTSMIQQVGTMYGELNYMQPFTVSSAAYYTIDASVSAFYSAGECSPIGFCTASVTDQLAASFYFSGGGPAMTIADTKTSSAPWAMLTASGDQSETFFLD